MIYKYDAYVELPDDETALALMDVLHLSLCGGAVDTDNDGNFIHECTRAWELRISEFRAIMPVPADAVAMPEDPSLANFNEIPEAVAAVEELFDGTV